MHKSGVWEQLADVAPQLKASVARDPSGASLDAQDIERLEQLAEDAYAAPRLRETFLQVLAGQITAAQSARAIKWYDSPTGRHITALEAASSASVDDMNRVLAEGNNVLSHTSAKRQALLAQTVRATRAAEGQVTLQINTTVSIMQGVANVLPSTSASGADTLRQAMEAQRPQMVAAASGVMLSLFALTYQSASDRSLEQYLQFLSSRSGDAISVAMMDALDKALSAAGRRFGSSIPKEGATLSL